MAVQQPETSASTPCCARRLAKVSMSLCSCHSIHADIVAPYLVALTTEEEQRDRWLPGFVSGEPLTAIGMTEP